jgi:U6 snRNA-associated Sm-like protein LSm8
LILIPFVESITVLTCDGRLLVGILVGHDQVQNLILNEAQERIYSEDEDVEIVPLGLYVVRGDNVVLVGEAHWKEDDDIRAEPVPHVQQHIT